MRANSIFLVIAFILNIVVGLVSYFRAGVKRNITYFALLFITVSFWALSLYIRTLLENQVLAFLATRIAYISALFANIAFLLFVINFPVRLPGRIAIWIHRIMMGFSMILAILLAFTRLIIADFSLLISGGGQVTFGPLSIVFNVFVPLSFITAIYFLSIQYKSSNDKTERVQVTYIASGAAITIVGGVISNVVLPAYGNFSWNWLGPVFTTALVTASAYAIVEHHLFSVKVITTEIFGFAISVLSLFEFLAADSFNERVIKFGVLVLTTGFAYLLIKSVWREVNAREEIERLAKELEFANKELKRLDQAKSDFISIASHQLRTPLSIIKGYISMIREGSYGAISDNVRKTLNKIYLSNERLVKLVADLLDLSRMESGKLQYEFAEFNIADMVDSTVDEFRTPAGDKKIELVWQKPKMPLAVWGDAWKLRQVVFNLIDNGLKYTEKGSLAIAITKHNHTITLSVKDTGVGMTPETAHTLFQKFTRGKDSFRTNVQGLGLGLFIAKQIVNDHQGKLWAESDGEGKGSAFFMELPTASEIRQKKDFTAFMESM